jgi:DNA-binding beta-propeller fold protein YncE
VAGSLNFRLVACDWTTPLAEVDTYDHATVIARHNDVSTWELVLPADTPAALVLLASAMPRLLIEEQASGVVWRSGPVMRFERSSSEEGELLTLNGVDDLVWLRRRLVHPQPGTAAPPYSTSAYDTRTGSASQVLAGYVDRNAGPSAVQARQVPGLQVPTPAPFGPAVTLSGRYQNLLEFLQPAAQAAGLGIRVRDLVFEVFQPAGAAVFSVDLGTLAAWTSVAEAPDANYVYVAGGGEGTARLIREYQDVTSVQGWGRTEAFQDRRDTTATADLDQAGAEALAEGVRSPSVDMEALDTAGQQFLRDWNVGDTATVFIAGRAITDVIAEAEVTIEPNTPVVVRPVIGGQALTLSQWRAISSQAKRLRQLDRV